MLYDRVNYDKGSSLIMSNLDLGNLLITRELVYDKKKDDYITSIEQINILL